MPDGKPSLFFFSPPSPQKGGYGEKGVDTPTTRDRDEKRGAVFTSDTTPPGPPGPLPRGHRVRAWHLATHEAPSARNKDGTTSSLWPTMLSGVCPHGQHRNRTDAPPCRKRSRASGAVSSWWHEYANRWKTVCPLLFRALTSARDTNSVSTKDSGASVPFVALICRRIFPTAA